jgi:hypothetical protein
MFRRRAVIILTGAAIGATLNKAFHLPHWWMVPEYIATLIVAAAAARPGTERAAAR